MVAFAYGEGGHNIETGSTCRPPTPPSFFARIGSDWLNCTELRGWLGRGRVRSRAYPLTEPGKEIACGTRDRLSTLLAFHRLGSRLATIAPDVDLRPAACVGEEQAGHMELIGLGLYRRLLALAVDQARGRIVESRLIWRCQVLRRLNGARSLILRD